MPTIAELGTTYSTLDFGDDSWIVVEIDGVTGRIAATDLQASLKEDPLVLQGGAISLGSATGTLAYIDAVGAGSFVGLTCTTLQAEKLSGQVRLSVDAGWGSGGLSFSNTADGSSGGFLARITGTNAIFMRLPSETTGADPKFVVYNAAGTGEVLTLSDAGQLAIGGGLSTGGPAVVGYGGLRVVGQVRLSVDAGWGSGGLSFSNTADGSSGGFLARITGTNAIFMRLPSETTGADPKFVVYNAAGAGEVLTLSDAGQLAIGGGLSTGGPAVVGYGGLRVVGQVRLSVDAGWGSGGLSFSNTADGSSGGFLARITGTNAIFMRLPSETSSAPPYFLIVSSSEAELVKIDDGGDIEVLTASRGIILKSPDGTRFRVTVDNAGALSTTSL